MYLTKNPEYKKISTSNLSRIFWENWHIFVMVKIIGFISYYLYVHILKSTDVSYSTPVIAISGILLTTGLSVLLLKEKISKIKIIGLFVGCLSIVLLK